MEEQKVPPYLSVLILLFSTAHFLSLLFGAALNLGILVPTSPINLGWILGLASFNVLVIHGIVFVVGLTLYGNNRTLFVSTFGMGWFQTTSVVVVALLLLLNSFFFLSALLSLFYTILWGLVIHGDHNVRRR